MSSSAHAVFFISFGGPEKREDIRPFLEIVTRGRRIPADRIEEVVHHYELIGGASPINAITRRQAKGVQDALAKTDTPLPVYVGNRNWHPFLEETLRKMAADGVTHAIGFPTAAYRCEASWERYLNAVEEARRNIGPQAPVISYVEPWFDHPLFIQAIVEKIKQAYLFPHPHLGKAEPHAKKTTGQEWSWVLTAHSIPVSMAEQSHYVQELRRTAELVANIFGVKNWTLAYTSRSGRPEDPWLEPDVCDFIRAEAQKGVREILAIPIGFVADHVEVLFDLDVEARVAATEAGVWFHRAQTVGDSPLFIQMIADQIKKVASHVPA